MTGRRATYTCAECAERLGEKIHTFYRYRKFRHAKEGMPDPISSFGTPKWDKATFDAWAERHHPLKPKLAANDQAPRYVSAAASDDEHRAHLHEHYGKRRQQRA